MRKIYLFFMVDEFIIKRLPGPMDNYEGIDKTRIVINNYYTTPLY